MKVSMKVSTTRQLCLLLAIAAFCVAKDHFDDADLNSDGKVDRNEFAALGAKVKSALLSVLDEPKVTELHADRHAAATAGLDMFPELHAFWPAFINSLMMIWATEIGDKTFFIAAILAMSNDRFVVFSGAVLALAVMTVLSSIMGFALPNLMPREYTHYGATVLFFYFGVKLLRDASLMDSEGRPSEELEEVEEELQAKHDASLEEGEDQKKSFSSKNLKVFTQAFTMTFLAEWGDRSQIATIALAAAKDPYGVTAGGICGHAMCTGLAVVGGRMLAAKISEKTVTYIGGSIFLLFALHSLVSSE